MEKKALTYLRAYDKHEADFDQALEAVMEYSAPLTLEKPYEGRQEPHVLKYAEGPAMPRP